MTKSLTIALAMLTLGGTAACAASGTSARERLLTEMRSGTPTFSESSDKQARLIADCVRKDRSWAGASRSRTRHGLALLAPAAKPEVVLDIAEEGDRRRVTLWPREQPSEGEAPHPTEAPEAGARLAAVKACI